MENGKRIYYTKLNRTMGKLGKRCVQLYTADLDRL